jgi:ubiquinone/menaquinone biosynthesis C-methylase UbiE
MPESDWDAVRYHRISDPQLGWARAVAARLRPAPGERILDLGCGTARLTSEIAATPGILVVGHMTAQAAADDPPYSLDYWRLNMSGRRQAA